MYSGGLHPGGGGEYLHKTALRVQTPCTVETHGTDDLVVPECITNCALKMFL